MFFHEAIQDSSFVKELKQLNNVEAWSNEEFKKKYPQLNEKQKTKQNVLKHLLEKMLLVGSPQIIEKAFEDAYLLYDSGQYDCNKFKIAINQLIEALEQLDLIQNFIDERFEELKISAELGRINIKAIKALEKNLSQEEFNKRIVALQDSLKTYLAEHSQQDFRLHANFLGLAIIAYNLQNDHDYTEFLEIYSADDYQEIVFALCPHFLQYYVVALLHQKNFNQPSGYLRLESIANVLQQPNFQYDNSILKFIDALLNKFDFENANNLIKEIEEHQKNDAFLRNKQLVELCQRFFFNVYIRVYSTINIKEYGGYLRDKDPEVWLVNAIRNYNLKAQINSEEGIITVLEETTNNQEEQIIRKIQEIIPKSSMLVNNLERATTIKK